jgi:hypothetical protein
MSGRGARRVGPFQRAMTHPASPTNLAKAGLGRPQGARSTQAASLQRIQQ